MLCWSSACCISSRAGKIAAFANIKDVRNVVCGARTPPPMFPRSCQGWWSCNGGMVWPTTVQLDTLGQCVSVLRQVLHAAADCHPG
jgi:hypothetical protein